jgi:chemotaxis protein MotB
MSGQENRPIIIKKVKKVSGGGHHGGAWKVAYADFVTAMMAFFMLMWLLNATTEQQRKGLADYFSPTLPISRMSGGGDGMFGGDDIFTQETLAESGAGPNDGGEDVPPADSSGESAAAIAAEVDALRQIEEILMGTGGESLISDIALRHVVTRLTDEGLVIEIFALPDTPIFDGDTDTPMPTTRELIEMVARVASVISNPVAISAHVAARPIVRTGSPGWDISGARADVVRRTLEGAGLDPERVMRVTEHSDQSPVTDNPLEPRNERIEITLLRLLR